MSIRTTEGFFHIEKEASSLNVLLITLSGQIGGDSTEVRTQLDRHTHTHHITNPLTWMRKGRARDSLQVAIKKWLKTQLTETKWKKKVLSPPPSLKTNFTN